MSGDLIDRQYSCSIAFNYAVSLDQESITRASIGHLVEGAPGGSFRPCNTGLLAFVGFVGMVHELGSLSDTLARGRLRGPKRRKPKAHLSLKQIDL